MKLAISLACLPFTAVLGCGSQTEVPSRLTPSAIDMLELPFGQRHAQFDGPSFEFSYSDPRSMGYIAGFAAFDAPIASGPLAGTFHDYSVYIESIDRRIFAAEAKRVFPSHEECRIHHAVVVSSVKSKFNIDSESGADLSMTNLVSGGLKIEVSCLSVGGVPYETLRLHIVDSAVAESVRAKTNDQLKRGSPN